MIKTYRGWTEEQIQEAELNGDYIPQPVMIDYVNNDTDQDDEAEKESLLSDDDE